jgi:CO/xanthine dehydrogenase Mo-binding subunit
VANAVEDALTPFGVTVRDLPITPERVWRWMQESATHVDAAGRPD